MDEIFLFPFQLLLYIIGFIVLKIFSLGRLKIDGIDSRNKYRYDRNSQLFEFQKFRDMKVVPFEWTMLIGLIFSLLVVVVFAVIF